MLSDLGYLIGLRHLIRSRAVTNLKKKSKNFFFTRSLFWDIIWYMGGHKDTRSCVILYLSWVLYLFFSLVPFSWDLLKSCGPPDINASIQAKISYCLSLWVLNRDLSNAYKPTRRNREKERKQTQLKKKWIHKRYFSQIFKDFLCKSAFQSQRPALLWRTK